MTDTDQNIKHQPELRPASLYSVWMQESPNTGAVYFMVSFVLVLKGMVAGYEAMQLTYSEAKAMTPELAFDFVEAKRKAGSYFKNISPEKFEEMIQKRVFRDWKA
ncbi:MAG: hypothetical protein IPH78_13390 [Bacteroidetes bacterium]|nr:hypothetical protein [Bacteroidota bacterium]